MSRIMTIWLPRWPVQRLLVEQPSLRPQPVFVCRRNHRGLLTVSAWAWAMPPAMPAGRRPAIEPGMSLAEAMAVLAAAYGSRACRMAHVADEDVVGDRQALETLARWARRFAPVVAVGPAAAAGSAGRQSVAQPQAAGGDCLQLDVTGTARFFGGESGLARTATWTLAARGLHVRVALADTPAASWAAARHTAVVAAAVPRQQPRRQGRWLNRQQRWVVVPPGQQRQLLAGMPLTALRLPSGVVETLAEVGVESIGHLLQLSRSSLRQRFDRLVTLRLAAFLGETAEPLQPPGGDPLPTASHAFDLPVLSRDLTGDDLPVLCDRLVRDCLRPLVSVGKGIASLQMRLDGVSGRPPTVIDVGLFRPVASAAHLVELIMLRLGRVRLPCEFAGVTVEVLSAAPLPCRQQLLFDAASPTAAPQAGQQVAGLLDRLASRLGRAAVVEPQLLADAQPEAAWAAVPVAGVVGLPSGRRVGGRGGKEGAAAAARTGGSCRPTFILPRPQPLEVLAVAPEGPPVRFRWRGRVHEVARVRGPERIETAWWRGPTVRRDYYIVETGAGGRFWLFRGLRRQTWFLHGTFG